MSGARCATRAVVAACLALGLATPTRAAQDPLASPTAGNVDLGKPVAATPKPPVKAHRSARHRTGTRPPRHGARVPDVARPAITGVAVLAPAVRDYPRLAPEPRDDAAALTPAFYIGGLARFVTQPPPPAECRRQRRDDAGQPGYIPGAPLYCAQVDP